MKAYPLFRSFFPRILAVIIFLGLAFPGAFALAQEGQIRFETSYSVDWVRSEMLALADFNLAQAGIRLPSGRFQAEEILLESYTRLLRPLLLPLRVDSSTTLRELLDRGEIRLEDMDRFSREADRMPPSLSRDLGSMYSSYRISLERISAFLMRHRPGAEPERPLIPAITADYTGIIIIANGELPIHGRHSSALLEPCLFPKIWDTNMNVIYDKAMFEPGERNMIVHYTVQENVFRPTPSGLEGELAALAGPRPLRIFARGVFGVYPTDPIIDREDAMRIISSENNRRLLREGRVIFVLNEESLQPQLNTLSQY